MAKLFLIFFTYTQLSLHLGSIVQYEYIKQEDAPLYGELSCQVSSESSFMACVILSVRSKSVSFFFNKNEHVCRWDCIFLASRSCTTYCTEPWSYYGMYPSVCMLHHIIKMSLLSLLCQCKKREYKSGFFIMCLQDRFTCTTLAAYGLNILCFLEFKNGLIADGIIHNWTVRKYLK